MKALSRNLAVATLFGLSYFPTSFAVQPRLALVIGNSDYNIANGRLPNARGDAEQVAERLRGLGFEVMLRTDVRTRAELKQAVESFIGQTSGREMALVYYSGHGVQHDDHNYLIPTQETISQAYQVEDNAVSVDYLLKGMKEMAPQLGVVILDACRTNPFPKSGKGADRGLTRIQSPSDIVVAYATEPGNVADDGDGTHSPYAQAFLKHLQDPASTALPVTEFFNRVGISVEQLTDGKQSPRQELPPLHYSYCFRHCNDAVPSIPEPQRAETTPAPKPATPNAETLIAGRYRDNGDGTVKDVKTNLQWMRCSVGHTWQDGMCIKNNKLINENNRYTLDEAMAIAKTVDFAGHTDWRLPSKEELLSLVYCSSGKPKLWNDTGNWCEGDFQKPVIVSAAFPNLPRYFNEFHFWSSSVLPYDGLNSQTAWATPFNDGYGGWRAKDHNYFFVRLVRSDQ